jgi:glutathione peroxidase
MKRLSLAATLLAICQTAAAQSCPAALNFSATPLIAETPQSLCQYKNKVVLIVNTASACGYTPQYEGLEKLYRQFKVNNLVVLGFPANDFGSQERGSNAQIASFCKVNFGVTFPMFQKLAQPIASDPLFSYLKKASGSTPGWNFHKYLIDK